MARTAPTCVRMIEQHYAGVIANWDGKQAAANGPSGLLAEIMDRTARGDQAGPDCKSPGNAAKALCRTRTDDPFLTMEG
jgi:hypothetical protein